MNRGLGTADAAAGVEQEPRDRVLEQIEIAVRVHGRDAHADVRAFFDRGPHSFSVFRIELGRERQDFNAARLHNRGRFGRY